MNKNLIIAKLERLNVFTQEKIEETNGSIQYWREKCEEYGENTALRKGEPTCNDCLKTAEENKKYYEYEIEENEALIKELREEARE